MTNHISRALNLIFVVTKLTIFLQCAPSLYAAPAPPFITDLNFGKNTVMPPSTDAFGRALMDFVGNSARRGKGSIARLSFDGTDPLQLPDPDLGTAAGGDGAKIQRLETPPNFQPFQIVMPSNVRKNANKTIAAPKNNNINSSTIVDAIDDDKNPEDYEKLAKFLQQFMNRQPTKKMFVDENLKNIRPKTANHLKLTIEKDDESVVELVDEHQQKVSSNNMIKTNRRSSTNNNKASLLLSNATRGTVIGTVPVSVEIGHDKNDNFDGENAMESEHQQQSEVTAAEDNDDGKRINVAEVFGTKNPAEELVGTDDKMGEDKRPEKNTNSANTAGINKRWDGSVERMMTLKMSLLPSSASTASSAAVGGTNMKSNGQPAAAATTDQKQLLRRVIVEQHKHSNKNYNYINNSSNGRIDLDDAIQPFFYQVDDHDKDGSIDNANVEILREGFARQLDTQYVFVASITLIKDGGKIILVDTGIGTDINGRTDLIRKLSQYEIAPPAVNYVVITHGHPDHSGNTNDFPDAVHFQGVMSHHWTKFNFTGLFDNIRHQLTENVALINTPGHTSEDISVVVKNVNGYGTVIVSGDVFISAEDLSRPQMWRPLAWNETAQEQNRRTILCMANFVVPGHGKMFRVSAKMRERVNCSSTMPADLLLAHP